MIALIPRFTFAVKLMIEKSLHSFIVANSRNSERLRRQNVSETIPLKSWAELSFSICIFMLFPERPLRSIDDWSYGNKNCCLYTETDIASESLFDWEINVADIYCLFVILWRIRWFLSFYSSSFVLHSNYKLKFNLTMQNSLEIQICDHIQDNFFRLNKYFK